MTASAMKDPYPDPSIYSIDPDAFRTMIDSVYDRLWAPYGREGRRVLVSLSCGLLVFAVGFLIAASIDFMSVYVSTVGVYIVVGATALGFDQIRHMKQRYFTSLNQTREAFIVSDNDYLADIQRIIKPGTARGPALAIAALMFIPVSAAVILTFIAPTSFLGPIARALVPPSFDSTWFTGSNLIGKAAIIEWLLLSVSFAFGNGIFVSLIVLSGWPKLALKWAVIPVPSYVAANFAVITEFYTRGMIDYAIGVLLTILLYGARPELGLIAVAGILAVIGVYWILLPRVIARRLVERARQQIAISVSRRYLTNIFPVASDEPESGDKTTANPEEAYSLLEKLQDVMQTVNVATDDVLSPVAVLGAILTQAIPFLGFLIPYIPHQWLPFG